MHAEDARVLAAALDPCRDGRRRNGEPHPADAAWAAAQGNLERRRRRARVDEHTHGAARAPRDHGLWALEEMWIALKVDEDAAACAATSVARNS